MDSRPRTSGVFLTKTRWNLILAFIGLAIFLQLILFFDVGSSRTALQEQLDALKHKLGSSGASDIPTTSTDVDFATPVTPKISHDPSEEYVAFCVAVKDQHIDIPEWFVHHYHHHGIRRFYVEDQGSDPPLETFEFPGIPREALTFKYWTEEERSSVKEEGDLQTHIYESCAARYGANHTWMAFFDIDEFLEVRNGETLDSVLSEFEQDQAVGAVGINWRIHTSDGKLVRQESVRKGFQTCIWDDDENGGEKSGNRVVKSIVRTDVFDHALTPHVFKTKPNKLNRDTYTVGEDGVAWAGVDAFTLRAPITRNRLALHHYTLKSKAEFEEKIHRWPAGLLRAWNYWDELEKDNPHVACPEMAQYTP